MEFPGCKVKSVNDIAATSIMALPVHVRKQSIRIQYPDEIPVDQVYVNPEQPRHLFDEQEMAELTESVRLHGVLIPILVERNTTGGYILHDGERRWRAARMAGLAAIPARILPSGADSLKLIDALVANLHSASMTIVEEALAYRRLGEVYGYGMERGSARKISRLLGLSRIRIYNALIVLKLPPAIQAHFAARKLPNNPDVIRALLHIPDDEARLRLANHLAAFPHPPTIQTVRSACTRLKNLLAASAEADRFQEKISTERRVTSAMRFSGKKPRAEWPEWEALYQLGKVPPWPVVNDAVMATCDGCAMRPAASKAICRDCPLVDCLRRMIKAVEK
jgi:ParB/RepB/Spo0J family partition protein